MARKKQNKQKNTYYTFVLDRSGSMGWLRKQTIDNFNEQINSLKKIEEEFSDQKHFITLIQFNGSVETIMEDQSLEEVQLLGDHNYQPKGSTSLYDAMGEAIVSLRTRRKEELKDRDYNSAFIMILTDGEENSSSKFDQKKIKSLITRTNKKKNWEIAFLGATENSITQARGAGISYANTTTFTADVEGMGVAAKGMGNALYARAMYRDAGTYSSNDIMLSSVMEDGSISDNLDMELVKNKIKKAKKV